MLRRYYVAVFGSKNTDYPVEGRVYPVPSKYETAKEVTTGDILLLCCWSGQGGLSSGDSWGYAAVVDKERRSGEIVVYYRSTRWPQPVKRSVIDSCLTDEEKRQLKIAPMHGAFLLEIGASSFETLLEKTTQA